MLEFIGASIRFIWTSIINLVRGKPTVSYTAFFTFKKGRNANMDKLAADGIIGFIFLILLLITIYTLTT